jgi:hypothetical protein
MYDSADLINKALGVASVIESFPFLQYESGMRLPMNEAVKLMRDGCAKADKIRTIVMCYHGNVSLKRGRAADSNLRELLPLVLKY